MKRRVDLYRFNAPHTVTDLVTGSDKDIGGFSECAVEFVKTPPHLLFRGNISFDLKPDTLTISAGYCGFRTKEPVGTLFGSLNHDLTLFSHLEVKARTPDAQKKFLLNLKASTFADLDVYQYPLRFVSDQWHTFHIPLSKFILTQKGYLIDSQRELPSDQIQTIGVSILRQQGPFHLELTHFAAINPNEISLEELEFREMQFFDDEVEEEENDPKMKDLFHTVKVYVEGEKEFRTYNALDDLKDCSETKKDEKNWKNWKEKRKEKNRDAFLTWKKTRILLNLPLTFQYLERLRIQEFWLDTRFSLFS